MNKNSYNSLNFGTYLAQLQFNVENGIDVENSKAQIDTIVNNGGLKLNGVKQKSLSAVENAFDNYKNYLSNNPDIVNIATKAEETLKTSIDEFLTIFNAFIEENKDAALAGVAEKWGSGKVDSYLNSELKNINYYYPKYYDGGVWNKEAALKEIVATAEYPAQLRQAAANILNLAEQNEQNSPKLKEYKKLLTNLTDDTTLDYNAEKSKLYIDKYSKEIATLEAKTSLTNEEKVQLETLRANLKTTQDNYNKYFNRESVVSSANQTAPVSTVDWETIKLSEPTYTTSVSIGDTTDATTYFTTNIFDLDTIHYESDLDAFEDLYDTTEVETGDLNDSWLTYAISQLTEDQKMNAVSMNLQDGTVTVHLPGALGSRISTPRSYNFWEIAATTTLTNNGETINLSKGSLITKAIEMALIDNFGVEIFSNDYGYTDAFKLLTGSSATVQTSIYNSDAENVTAFTLKNDDNRYVVTGYDSTSKTISYANINDPKTISTMSFDNLKKNIKKATIIENRTSYSQSAEASKYIAENTMSLIMSTVGDIPGVKEFMEQYSSIEEMAADAQNVQQTITTAMEDLTNVLSGLLNDTNESSSSVSMSLNASRLSISLGANNSSSSLSSSDLALASNARDAISNWANKYANTTAAPLLKDTATSLTAQLTPDTSGNLPTQKITSSDGILTGSMQNAKGNCFMMAPFNAEYGNDISKWITDNGDGTVTFRSADGKTRDIDTSKIKEGTFFNPAHNKQETGRYYETTYKDFWGREKILQVPLAGGDKDMNYFEINYYENQIAKGKTDAKGLGLAGGQSGSLMDIMYGNHSTLQTGDVSTLGSIFSLFNNTDCKSLEKTNLSDLFSSSVAVVAGSALGDVAVKAMADATGTEDKRTNIFAYLESDKRMKTLTDAGYSETDIRNYINDMKAMNPTVQGSRDGGILKINAKDSNGNPIVYDFYTGHEYTVVSVNKETGEVTLRNPHDSDGTNLYGGSDTFTISELQFKMLMTDVDYSEKPKSLLEKIKSNFENMDTNGVFDKLGKLSGGITGTSLGIVGIIESFKALAAIKAVLGTTQLAGLGAGLIGGGIMLLSIAGAVAIGYATYWLSKNGDSLWDKISDFFSKFGGGWASPLSFDLNNDGVKTTSETVDFDIDGDGKADKINNSADYVLVFDADGNGIVGENGREVFGDYTDIDGDGMADGYSNGFEALKSMALKYNLIGENDTKLDADDLKFLQEKVGLSFKNGYQGQTYTFEELGITEINLPSTDEVEKIVNFDGQDNILMTQKGATFIVDGIERTYADIWHKKLEE